MGVLDGCRVLLVEDEYMLAHDLRRDLEDAGAMVLGPEPSVARALARAESEPRIDAAVLDVNLSGQPVFPVAEALANGKAPFLFATGYEEEAVKGRFPDVITCDKPVDMRQLIRSLQALIRPSAA